MKLIKLSILAAVSLIAVSCGSSAVVSQKNDADEVNVGYGTTKKDLKLGATDRVKVDTKDVVNYTSMLEYLRGRVPGVNIDSSGRIIIRGINSINADCTPLFIVDGLEVSSIDNIDPRIVKSVDVIKDGTAAIYGMKGANGVIIVTTRTGSDK